MARFLTGALIVAGGLLAVFSMLPLGMAGDVCAAGDRGLICSPTWQVVVFWLPVAGLVAGVLVATVGGRRAADAERSPLLWVGAGWTVFLVVLGVGYALAVPG